MLRRIPVEVITVPLIFLFVYTAISKMADATTFSKQLHNQPLPVWLTDNLFWVIPTAELITSCLLAIGITRFYGLILSAMLMLIFTSYVALILFGFYHRVPCSCGGVIASLSWTGHLFFNTFFLLLSLFGIYHERKNT
jgi:putative oxidoreductase